MWAPKQDFYRKKNRGRILGLAGKNIGSACLIYMGGGRVDFPNSSRPQGNHAESRDLTSLNAFSVTSPFLDIGNSRLYVHKAPCYRAPPLNVRKEVKLEGKVSFLTLFSKISS